MPHRSGSMFFPDLGVFGFMVLAIFALIVVAVAYKAWLNSRE